MKQMNRCFTPLACMVFLLAAFAFPKPLHAQLPVVAGHPRLLLDSAAKAKLLARKAANDPRWLTLQADADDLAARDVMGWTPANTGVWNTQYIFYNYCGSSWDEAVMSLAMAHQLTKGTNTGAFPTAYSDQLIVLADTILAGYAAYPPCSGCPNMFLWNTTYATRHMGPVLGVIYDWCYDELGAGRRDALRGMMEDFFAYMRVPYNTYQNTTYATGNYFFGHVLLAAYFGHALMYDSPDAQEMIDWSRQRILGTHSGTLGPNDLADNWMRQSYTGGLPSGASASYLGPATYTAAPQMDGLPVQGWGYSGETFSRLVDLLTLVRTATGENLRDSLAPWITNTSIAFAHALTPNRFQLDNSGDFGSFRGNLLSYGLPLRIAAVTEGMPQGPFAQHFYQNWIRPVSLAATWNDGYPAAAWEVLYYEDASRPSTAFSYPPFHPSPSNPVMTTVSIDRGLTKYYLRENWEDTATWASLNVSTAFYDDHDHHSAGHFQIVRGDNHDGDDLLLVGANEVGNGGAFGMNGIEGGTCYHMSSSLSNTLFFDDFHDYTEVNTNGYVVGGQSFYGSDFPTHQEQNDDWSYVRADLTSAYYRKGELADTVNRTLDYFYRSFLYLRDADLFLCYDRIKAMPSSNPNGDYLKHLRWHFMEQPVVNGNDLTATMDNSRLHLHTVQPAAVTIQTVDESNNPDNIFGPGMNYAFDTYTYRAEVSVPGNPRKQDLLTVMQPAALSTPEMTTFAQATVPGNMEGSRIQVLGQQHIVLFNRDSVQLPAPVMATSYAFAWLANTTHTLCGMLPGQRYNVDYNGQTVDVSTDPNGQHQASPAGVLQFTVALPNAIAPPVKAALQFSVYPNPSSGLVHLQWPAGEKPTELTLVNAFGQVVQRTALSAGARTYDLRIDAPGVYLLRLRDAHGHTAVRKVVIQ